MGITFAFFQADGKIPLEREILINCEKGLAIASTHILIKKFPTPSTPQALETSTAFKSSLTSSSVVDKHEIKLEF